MDINDALIMYNRCTSWTIDELLHMFFYEKNEKLNNLNSVLYVCNEVARSNFCLSVFFIPLFNLQNWQEMFYWTQVFHNQWNKAPWKTSCHLNSIVYASCRCSQNLQVLGKTMFSPVPWSAWFCRKHTYIFFTRFL